MRHWLWLALAGVLWAGSAQGGYIVNDDYSTDTTGHYTEYSTEGPHGSVYTVAGGVHEGDSHTWLYNDGEIRYDRWDNEWRESFYLHNTARMTAQTYVAGTISFYT